MKINIVTVKSGWILQKIAERIMEASPGPPFEFTVSHQPDINADVNFYVDIQNCYFGKKTNLDIGFLTHADLDSKSWLKKLFEDRNVFQLDGITGQNQRYLNMAAEIGYPENKMIKIVPAEPCGKFPLRKIVVGVVSRGGFPGYGTDLMVDLFSTADLENFHFRFLGSGWEDVIAIAEGLGVNVKYFQDENYDFYPFFYQTIDYLLIPTLYTAGPMSMIEALASGVPIISSDVGLAGYEFQPDYVYPPGDTRSLKRILNKIQIPMLKRREQVSGLTYENYVKKFVNFIERLQ